MTESCECADIECLSENRGGCSPCGKPATVALRRVDWHEDSPLFMCEGCAEDALESGLFEAIGS